MAFDNQLGPTVHELVESWVPSKAYRKETRFRDDLMEFLEEQLNHSGGGMFGQSRTYSLRKERGRSRADITVDDEVGIELKREITNNKLRRLRDQIRDLEREYAYVIICACGVKETGKWNELRQEFEDHRGGLGLEQGPPIRFVEKRKDGRTFTGANESSGRGGIFGNLGLGDDDPFSL